MPCPACKRHVATREITCPFCARAVSPVKPKHIVLVGKVTRAAIFSAALAACRSDDKPSPAPVPAQGSDDLEKLLDHDGSEVAHPTPIDASVAQMPDDAAAIAESVDAAVPDAGIDAAEQKRIANQRIADKKRREAERTRREEERRRREQEELMRKMQDHRNINKPYGAPPARKRLV
ncbi:MAG TPA: hypothetical protein VIV40_42635 [Kofleriaceae bacterium]